MAWATQTETPLFKQYDAGEPMDLLDDSQTVVRCHEPGWWHLHSTAIDRIFSNAQELLSTTCLHFPSSPGRDEHGVEECTIIYGTAGHHIGAASHYSGGHKCL